MGFLITQTDVLKALNNLMGRRQLSSGFSEDLERYCQEAFNFAWRYYKWSWTLRRATVDISGDGYLPEDFDIDGYRSPVSYPGQEWQEVPLDQYDLQPTGDRIFALEYDSTANRYKVITSFAVDSIPFIYQVIPPTLAPETEVPFPSAMTIGVGAAIWAKQGENPTRADVSQEWDIFRDELDQHVARSERNKPVRRGKNRQEVSGTYTGDVRV